MSTKKKIVGILYFIEFWWESAGALIAIYFSRRVLTLPHSSPHLTSPKKLKVDINGTYFK